MTFFLKTGVWPLLWRSRETSPSSCLLVFLLKSCLLGRGQSGSSELVAGFQSSYSGQCFTRGPGPHRPESQGPLSRIPRPALKPGRRSLIAPPAQDTQAFSHQDCWARPPPEGLSREWGSC